jgi:hypothetical protein
MVDHETISTLESLAENEYLDIKPSNTTDVLYCQRINLESLSDSWEFYISDGTDDYTVDVEMIGCGVSSPEPMVFTSDYYLRCKQKESSAKDAGYIGFII